MRQIITAKLKLITTPEQHHLLRQTQLAYRDALNYVSRYAFENGKTSNNDRLQKGTYHEIRVLNGLPSQMACNVPRQVAGTYKSLQRTAGPTSCTLIWWSAQHHDANASCPAGLGENGCFVSTP